VRVDILINHAPCDAFSTIVHKASADIYGRKMAEKLRELIPRQLFDVPIQAAIGGASSPGDGQGQAQGRLAKCYGGDITRKRKLLEKQKEGKKRMKNIGGSRCPGGLHLGPALGTTDADRSASLGPGEGIRARRPAITACPGMDPGTR